MSERSGKENADQMSMVWQAFIFISQPTIFQPKTFGGKRSKHGVLKRWHAFICDKTEATAEQQTRSADRGDVIIVDGATRWDGEKCEGIKNEYLMRADRAPQKDVKEPGTVATRDLFCCCPACLVGDFRSCEFITETGNFPEKVLSISCHPCLVYQASWSGV